MPCRVNLYAVRLMGSLLAVRSGQARSAVVRRAWSCLLINAAELLERTEEAVLFRVRADLRDHSGHLRVDTFVTGGDATARASQHTRLSTSVQSFRETR